MLTGIEVGEIELRFAFAGLGPLEVVLAADGDVEPLLLPMTNTPTGTKMAANKRTAITTKPVRASYVSTLVFTGQLPTATHINSVVVFLSYPSDPLHLVYVELLFPPPKPDQTLLFASSCAADVASPWVLEAVAPPGPRLQSFH